MKIKVISVEVTNRGKFDQAEVTFKNLSFDGKVEAKKHMSFTSPAVFNRLKSAATGEEITVLREKDDKNYWQWIGLEEGGETQPQAAQAATKGTTTTQVAPKSTYETAEERAKKQVYIVRQSSISAAIDTLKTDKKNPTKEEVVNLAKYYEAYVFGVNLEADAEPLPEFDDEDIPL